MAWKRNYEESKNYESNSMKSKHITTVTSGANILIVK